jgi:hypothetical protein
METILLAITVVSLLVALIMSAAAWRMSREERARAAARVAALAADSSNDDEDQAIGAVPHRPAHRVAARDAAVASSRPLVTTRAADLNLDVFAAEELPLRVAPVTANAAANDRTSPPPSIANSLLRGGEPSLESAGRQRGLVFAAVILFVVLGGGAYWALSRSDANGNAAAAAPATAVAPLELVSLRHERHGSRLSLSGLVRNPNAGTALDGLTSVVFLFDAQGGFITSGRAAVDFKRIAAGDESPFVITVEAPPNVARYRVSFRTDAGVVAHVDRRGEQPVAAASVGKD